MIPISSVTQLRSLTVAEGEQMRLQKTVRFSKGQTPTLDQLNGFVVSTNYNREYYFVAERFKRFPFLLT